jgi:hypothetical protein
LRFLVKEIDGNQTRQILLATIQVMTSSSVALRGRRRSRLPIMAVPLLMPAVASVLLISDWWYFVSSALRHGNMEFVTEPQFYGGFVGITVLVIEIWIFADMFGSLQKLSHAHRKLSERGSHRPGGSSLQVFVKH